MEEELVQLLVVKFYMSSNVIHAHSTFLHIPFWVGRVKLLDIFQVKILHWNTQNYGLPIDRKITKNNYVPIFRIPGELQLDKARMVYMVYNGT